MYFVFFIYSFAGVCLKIASGEHLLSFKYIFYFFIVIFILGLYAFLWQQVLKNISLSIAMANKPLVLILGILWANIFFGEKITWHIVLGGVLILLGITIIGKDSE